MVTLSLQVLWLLWYQSGQYGIILGSIYKTGLICYREWKLNDVRYVSLSSCLFVVVVVFFG